ncbi:MAG TPA: hypothetical protein VFM21_06680 [Terriglobia bacterium]|nr:hypothetical protein [Terriglobia bacterium]
MSTNGARNGPPLAGDWLCRTCSHALIQKGYSDSEEQVSCAYGYWEIPRPLPFKIRECSGYEDRRLSGYKGMEEIAWSIRSMSAGRRPGFIATPESKTEKHSD